MLSLGSSLALSQLQTWKSCPTRIASVRRTTQYHGRQQRVQTAVSCTAEAPPKASPLSGVTSEEQLFAVLKGAVAAGKIPERLLQAMEELYTNYKNAVLGSGAAGATEEYVAQVRTAAGAAVLGCRADVHVISTGRKDVFRAFSMRVQVMASIAEQSLVQLTQPFTFSSYHQRILEPYNFYEFGQRYVR